MSDFAERKRRITLIPHTHAAATAGAIKELSHDLNWLVIDAKRDEGLECLFTICICILLI